MSTSNSFLNRNFRDRLSRCITHKHALSSVGTRPIGVKKADIMCVAFWFERTTLMTLLKPFSVSSLLRLIRCCATTRQIVILKLWHNRIGKIYWRFIFRKEVIPWGCSTTRTRYQQKVAGLRSSKILRNDTTQSTRELGLICWLNGTLVAQFKPLHHSVLRCLHRE